MAKREKSNKYYSSVVGGGIYNHYGVPTPDTVYGMEIIVVGENL